MNIRHVVIYTFTVSSTELKEIIGALQESPHPDAQNLAVDIQKQVDKSRKEILRRFQTQHTVVYQGEEEP